MPDRTLRNYYDTTPTYDPNAGTAKFVMAMSVVQVKCSFHEQLVAR
jgi:hypothetical protein